MVQTIDQDKLLEEKRKGINQYYFQRDRYQKPHVSDRDLFAGFKQPKPELTSTLNWFPKMTAKQAKETLAVPYTRQVEVRTPDEMLLKYFGSTKDPRGASSGFDFSFEMPEYTVPTFEDIYGMSEEEWQFEQQRKGDLAQFEPAWAARSAAETSATEAVDRLIREQESYGALTGQEIQYTKQQRSTMISDMFADMYGEEQEAYIDEIVSKYGLGGDYAKGVKRGTVGRFGVDQSIASVQAGTGRKGIKSTILTDEDILGVEETLG